MGFTTERKWGEKPVSTTLSLDPVIMEYRHIIDAYNKFVSMHHEFIHIWKNTGLIISMKNFTISNIQTKQMELM